MTFPLAEVYLSVLQPTVDANSKQMEESGNLNLSVAQPQHQPSNNEAMCEMFLSPSLWHCPV